MSSETFERTTTIRLPRPTKWIVLAIAAAVVAMVAIGAVLPHWFLFFAVPGPWLFGRRHIARARIVASREGLRIDERLLPRSDFSTALLRHEDDTTYVALRGKTNIDVQVASNVEADELLAALELDAASAAVEFPLSAALPIRLAIGTMVALFVGMTFFGPRESPWWLPTLFALGFALFGAFRLASRVTLRVGADGILVRRVLGRSHFLRHDAIADVRADGDAVVVEPARGEPMTFRVPGARRDGESRRQEEHRADEANAIVRRITQARRAFEELGRGPDLAAALARGSRTTHDWMTELRRIGAGAAGTFRTIGIARDQLFGIVESTRAATEERLAAMVALRATLTDDEKPRVRVAAERCALPELRERMLRIAETEDEGALEEELARLENP